MHEKGPVLLAIARSAIAEKLGIAYPAGEHNEPWLDEPAATFVTLHRHGELRGCIGTLTIHRPLREDVRCNAVAAAFEDPRFPPVTDDEFGEIDIEVSILTTPEPLAFTDEADAIARLRPFEDGVVLEYGLRRGTFLPQVWQQLPDPQRFMAHLKVKAGLPPDFWHPAVRLLVYGVEKFSEVEP